jgi:serine/threonine-protein kinase SRPK3
MFDLGNASNTASIDAWLNEFPPRAYPEQKSLTKMVTPYVSQQLPQASLDLLASRTFKLADFGSGEYGTSVF